MHLALQAHGPFLLPRHAAAYSKANQSLGKEPFFTPTRCVCVAKNKARAHSSFSLTTEGLSHDLLESLVVLAALVHVVTNVLCTRYTQGLQMKKLLHEIEPDTRACTTHKARTVTWGQIPCTETQVSNFAVVTCTT